MSNYLKNVLVGFARPTSTAQAVALAHNHQNSESFNLFYPSPSPESKPDAPAKSPRQLSSEAKQRLSYPITQS